jgi:hypothetical protein
MENSIFLEGLWRGKGQVTDNIPYLEELEVKKIKLNIYSIIQKTRNEIKGPLHTETGFIRVINNTSIEFILSHPFGVAEISEGTISNDTITVKSLSLTRTSSAKQPFATSFTRYYTIQDNNTLIYDMYLGVNNQEETHHLRGELLKIIN